MGSRSPRKNACGWLQQLRQFKFDHSFTHVCVACSPHCLWSHTKHRPSLRSGRYGSAPTFCVQACAIHWPGQYVGPLQCPNPFQYVTNDDMKTNSLFHQVNLLWRNGWCFKKHLDENHLKEDVDGGLHAKPARHICLSVDAEVQSCSRLLLCESACCVICPVLAHPTPTRGHSWKPGSHTLLSAST